MRSGQQKWPCICGVLGGVEAMPMVETASEGLEPMLRECYRWSQDRAWSSSSERGEGGTEVEARLMALVGGEVLFR